MIWSFSDGFRSGTEVITGVSEGSLTGQVLASIQNCSRHWTACKILQPRRTIEAEVYSDPDGSTARDPPPLPASRPPARRGSPCSFPPL